MMLSITNHYQTLPNHTYHNHLHYAGVASRKAITNLYHTIHTVSQSHLVITKHYQTLPNHTTSVDGYRIHAIITHNKKLTNITRRDKG